MEFYNKIKQRRKELGISQVEMASRVGVAKSTYSLYESGGRQPDVEKIKLIARALNTTGDYLLGLGDSETLSADEQNMIKKYRTLDEHGKDMVDIVLAREYDRLVNTPPAEVLHLYPVTAYLQPASAGTGNYIDDSTFETIELVKTPPEGTSYMIRVMGDSMEPTFSDGDYVFISANREVCTGDIGLFWVDGNIYIKECGKTGLISHNAEYPELPCGSFKTVHTLGKVLGKCTDDYLA